MKKLIILLFGALNLQAQQTYFFGNGSYNKSLSSPEKFLQYPVGDLHTRYDKMVAYFKNLESESKLLKIEPMGLTNEHREQMLLVISAPENLSKLEEIRQKHLLLTQNKLKPEPGMPLVIWLGFNVHGNEPSGGEAAILTAYHLLASEDPEVKNWLKNAIILMEPVINPDGRDRHTTWVNSNRSQDPIADRFDREHTESWPMGRTNHYWFDLNRDWFLATQVESQNRLKLYHKWLPNVVTDFHEMGTNATHFFEPSKENAENPLVPKSVYRSLNLIFAKYFQETMDKQGSLYYTKESFDNFYPGYGSSYPDVQGGLGLLFEQASSRGHLQESQHGNLAFRFTIKNQYHNALATVKAGIENKELLLNHQYSFFEKVIADAKAAPTKAYLVSEEHDQNRFKAFQKLLQTHHIDFHELSADLKIENNTYKKGQAILIPTAQAQNLLIRSIFDKPKAFADSIFYDASTWNLALAYNLNFKELKESPVLGEKISNISSSYSDFGKSNYAYLIPHTDLYSHKFIELCLKNEVLIKTSFKTFNIGGRNFGYGTLMVPVQLQKIKADSLYTLLKSFQKQTGLEIIATPTGLSTQGVDLGSNSLQTIPKQKTAILVGSGVNSYEAGFIWHLTDTRVGLPLTKLDVLNFNNIPLNAYTTLIMVSGTYTGLDKAKLKAWVQQGGTLIAQKTAIDWLIKSELVKEKLIEPKADTTLSTYEQYPNLIGARNTGGAIFEVKADLSNPLLFGLTHSVFSIYRNGNTILSKGQPNINYPINYTTSPWLSGYVHPKSLKRIAGSAAAAISYEGAGRYIMFTDDLNFRATWLGTQKIFLNALYFGPIMNKPGGFEGQEE